MFKFLILFLLTVPLYGQEAQKLGNRANQPIELCKDLGGGSESCITINANGEAGFPAASDTGWNVSGTKNTTAKFENNNGSNAVTTVLIDNTSNSNAGNYPSVLNFRTGGNTNFAIGTEGSTTVAVAGSTANAGVIYTVGGAKPIQFSIDQAVPKNQINSSGNAEITVATDGTAGIGNVYSGTFVYGSGQIFSESNCTVNDGATAQYTRVGDVVTVSYSPTISTSGSGVICSFELTPPVGTVFTAGGQCAGTITIANVGAQYDAGRVTTNSGTNRCLITVYVTQVHGAEESPMIFSYQVLP